LTLFCPGKKKAGGLASQVGRKVWCRRQGGIVHAGSDDDLQDERVIVAARRRQDYRRNRPWLHQKSTLFSPGSTGQRYRCVAQIDRACRDTTTC